MALLFLFIIIGYVLAKLKAIPDNSAGVLSKLENNVFIPALVLGTFMSNFTIASISSAWQYFLGGTVTVLISMPLAIIIARLCTKDAYIRKIYTYGLSFSNFGFMGNAVVLGIFGEQVFSNYLIFVVPLWTMIYLWGVPALLIPVKEENGSVVGRLKAFVNPMFVAMVIGIALGLLSPYFQLPGFVKSAVGTLGDCMSPVAMLLTGMTVAKINLGATFKKLSLYIVSLVRLVAIPLACIAVLWLLPLPTELEICILCSVAMPLGLNTIVVPNAYGLDSTEASGMALISHLLSCVTIPIVLMIFRMI